MITITKDKNILKIEVSGTSGFYALDINLNSESFGTRIGTYTPIKNYWYPAMFLFPEDNILSSLPNNPIASSPKSQKILRNGQLIILREGKCYNITGQEL